MYRIISRKDEAFMRLLSGMAKKLRASCQPIELRDLLGGEEIAPAGDQ